MLFMLFLKLQFNFILECLHLLPFPFFPDKSFHFIPFPNFAVWLGEKKKMILKNMFLYIYLKYVHLHIHICKIENLTHHLLDHFENSFWKVRERELFKTSNVSH